MAKARVTTTADWVGSSLLMEAASDGGARRFRTRLAKLDTPIPRTPGGLDPNYQYILTRAAAEQCMASFIGKPARISKDFRDHVDLVEVDGEVKKRLAMPYGAIDRVEIEDADDGAYLVAEGNWWTMEEPSVANYVQAHQAEFGSSFEIFIKHPRGRWRQENRSRYIDWFNGTGLAMLLKDAAAYGELSQLVYASALPQIAGLPAAAAGAIIDEYEAEQRYAPMFALPLADQDWRVASKDARPSLMEWCCESGRFDPSRAATVFLWHAGDPMDRGAYHLPVADVIDGQVKLVKCLVDNAWWDMEGLCGDEGLLRDLTDAERERLLSVMRRLAARWTVDMEDAGVQAAASGRTPMPDEKGQVTEPLLAEMERRVQAETDLNSARAAAAAEQDKVKAAGFETVVAMAAAVAELKTTNESLLKPATSRQFETVEAMAAAYDEAKAKTAELEKALADLKAEADEAAEKAMASRADRHYERLAQSVPEDQREALRKLCRKEVETFTDEELELRVAASAQVAEISPQAGKPPVVAHAGASGLKDEITAAVAEAEKSGRFKTPEQLQAYKLDLWARRLSKTSE